MKFIQIRTEEELKKRYINLAKFNGMTLVAYIKMLLARELDKHNF